jgi:hypothetical protein
MGFFGGGKQQQSDGGGATNPNYVNQDLPEAVPVTVVVAEDPEAGYRPQQQQQQQQEMPVPIHKTNAATMYGTTTAPSCNTNETACRHLEFTTRLPTILSQCPHCRAVNVPTLTRTFPSAVTWLAVLVMLIIFWPLFWLPLVVDQCRHTTHVCTICHNEVGEVPAFADCCVTERG